jgi:hypothetical protein
MQALNILSSSVGAFLTATALLVAILLVWAPLWVNTYKIYKDRIREYSYYTAKERKNIETGVSLGIAWIYLAILFALVAFSLTTWQVFSSGSKEIPLAAVGFLVASLSMAIVQILQSFLSAACKFWKGKVFDEPLHSIDVRESVNCRWLRWLIFRFKRRVGVKWVLPLGAFIILFFSLSSVLWNPLMYADTSGRSRCPGSALLSIR